jgi:thiaminase/transcriptional activator TenA
MDFSKSAEELRKQLINDFKKGRGFADRLRQEFDYIWKKIDVHPFLLEIEKGKLPMEKYKTYAIQNYIYFTEWFRSCAAAAAKAATIAETLMFKNWMNDTEPEFTKYVDLIKQVGITERQLLQATIDPKIPLPAARAYIDYTFKIYSTGSTGEMAACILPCAWTYAPRDIGGLACPLRVAKGLADHYGVNREVALAYGNYSSQKPHFELLISLKDAISNEVKRGKEIAERIRDIFRRCSEYEYMWWDLAYRHDPNKEREIGSYF